MDISALQKERAKYLPKLPESLKGAVKLSDGEITDSVAEKFEL